MTQLLNTPEIKLGIVGVSRDCFPATLTKKRLGNLMTELKKLNINAEECSVVIENENDAIAAGREMFEKKCNAAVIYLGNFGPEGPTTILASRFHGPVMVVAAAGID